jgi:hypothetical protein
MGEELSSQSSAKSTRLVELAYTIIHNLDQLNEEDYETILEALPFTTISHFDCYFNFAKDYKKEYGKTPDIAYMNMSFNNAFCVPVQQWHKLLLDEFKHILTKQAAGTSAQAAIIQGDFSKASSLLSKYNAGSTLLKQEETIFNIIYNYKKKRDELGSGLILGIPELDDMYKYWAYKTLNVIVAPSGNFKTTTACSIVYNAIFHQGLNVVYLTLEDNVEMVKFNFISRLSFEHNKPFSCEELKKYLVPDSRIPLLETCVKTWDENEKGKLSVVSHETIGEFTPANIVKVLNEKQEEWGHIDVVVVDHFNIMNAPIKGLNLTGTALYSYYVRFMTNLSITFGDRGFVLIGLSQTTREGEAQLEKRKDLQMTHIADTSEIVRSATTVTCAYADNSLRQSNMLRLQNVKNRIGIQGQTVTVDMLPEYCKVGTTNKLQDADAYNTAQMASFTSNLLPSNASAQSFTKPVSFMPTSGT